MGSVHLVYRGTIRIFESFSITCSLAFGDYDKSTVLHMVAASRERQKLFAVLGGNACFIQAGLLYLCDIGIEILRVAQIRILVIDKAVFVLCVCFGVERSDYLVTTGTIERIKLDYGMLLPKFLLCKGEQWGKHHSVFHIVPVDQVIATHAKA